MNSKLLTDSRFVLPCRFAAMFGLSLVLAACGGGTASSPNAAEGPSADNTTDDTVTSSHRRDPTPPSVGGSSGGVPGAGSSGGVIGGSSSGGVIGGSSSGGIIGGSSSGGVIGGSSGGASGGSSGGASGGGTGGAPLIDVQAPTTPSNVVATTVAANQVDLSWAISTDDQAVTAYDVVNQTTVVATVANPPAQILGLTPATQYSFQIRARDAAGNVSTPSTALVVTTLAVGTPGEPTTPPPVGATGQEIYAQSCAVCHGVDGLGSALVPPAPVTRAMTLEEIRLATEQRMPPASPGSCVGECSAQVAQYIFDTFTNKDVPALVTDPLAGLPEGSTQMASLCSRIAASNRSDVVRDTFCSATPRQITSLRDLQAALGLAFTNPNPTGGRRGGNGNPAFALTGHSSSLVARSVNAINPRAIIFTHVANGVAPSGYVAMGFVRGDQFVEVAAADRNNNNALNFYLVRFTQACNVSDTCSDGDLLTPAVESNWLDVTVYDDVDLRNTVVDCLQCHQVNGPGTTKILRMQELEFPWTHWFRSNTAGNVLLADFRAAHGTTEDYAGIPANLIAASNPEELEDLVLTAGFRQPNEFPTEVIEAEVRRTAGQPADNSVPGVSPTWDRIYANSVTGQAIAVPYHDVKVTDPTRLSAAIQAYQGFRNGTLSAAALPNLRDLFYEAQLRDIGFKVKAGLDGPGIVTQACGQCHNSRLDQTIGRARFNIDLNAMSDTQGGVLSGAARDQEIGVAISRLLMNAEDVRKMPPEMFRTLESAEIDLVIGYLCGQVSAPIAQCAGR